MSDSINYNYNQRQFWIREFGNSYMQRNDSLDTVNHNDMELIGTTFEEIAKEFLEKLDRKSSVLEIGCNMGLRLLALRNLGFTNLHGLELNKKATEMAQKNNPKCTFINSSIEEFNPKGKQYDLVFTADVLIHINPLIINSVVEKMINLTKKYIFGFEYYSDNLVEVPYRDYNNVLWKQNFPSLFKKSSSQIAIIKEKKFYHKSSDLCDIAYLLQKK